MTDSTQHASCAQNPTPSDGSAACVGMKLPKPRIEVIDALRGFALMGILMIHCLEHFELYVYPETTSPLLLWLNTATSNTVFFLFASKAYAIFSLLFGVSFFIQMENQAERGVDFRGRFLWRLVLLYMLGYLNGLMYLGEIFAVYALFGLILIPLYRVATRWLVVLAVLCLLQLPNVIRLIVMIFNPDYAALPPSAMAQELSRLFDMTTWVYRDGSFGEVLRFNLWSGHMEKWIWFLVGSRWLHICGLFITGMLIGRYGIHRDRTLMIHYSKRALVYGGLFFLLFFPMRYLLPQLGIDTPTIEERAAQLCKAYADLGEMFLMVGLFVLAYFRLRARRVLNVLAPVGRMSMSNYMVQSVVGVILFYGYGFGLAVQLCYTYSFLVGLLFCTLQIVCSRLWLKHFYYGPMEWIWRSLTWMSFRKTPFRRQR